MAKVKCNKGGLSSLISLVESLKGQFAAIYDSNITNVQTENDTAKTNLEAELANTPKTLPDANNVEQDNPTYEKIKNKIEIAKNNATSLSNALKKKSELEKIFTTVIDGLNTIKSAVEVFESSSGEVTFDADVSTKTVVNNATGIEVKQIVLEVTDPDGVKREFTIPELLNAFYTTQGMEMNSVYQAALLRSELGLDPLSDEDILHVLQTSKSVMNFAFDLGLYGIASEEDLNNYKKNLQDAGFNVSSDVNALIKSVDFGDEDLKKKALKYLTGATAGAIFPGAVSAAITSLYGMYNNDSEIKLDDTGDGKTKSSNNGNNGSTGGYYASGSSGGNSGGRSGNSSNSKSSNNKNNDEKTKNPKDPSESDPKDPTATTPDEKKTTPTTTETETDPKVIGMVTIIEDVNTEPLETPEDASELPTEELPTIPEGLEKDYDDLARQQFEAQGDEAISNHRADVIEEANNLFDAEDKTALKEKLKQYGYTELDIETIIQDRDLTVSAMVSGDQREQLAKIAKELAEKDGLAEFDTVYDNEQTATSLTDGTTIKLLANLSGDEGVKKAYESLNTAETTYNEANTKAITAMAAVTAAQAKLKEVVDSIETSIQSEPSQWDLSTMTIYNEEIAKLHESTVQTVGGNINNWSDADIKQYQAAEAEATTKIAYQRGTYMASWTADQKTTYENKVATLKEKYIKAYGKDESKWSSEAKKNYETAKTNTYKQMAVEVGKKNLTADDKKQISSMAQKTKNEIITKNGNYNNWSEAQKKEYNEKVSALVTKYAGQTSTSTGEATWTKEQAQKYNDAVKEYNEAVKSAKEAMTDLNEAKTGYSTAKEELNTAKESFYNKLMQQDNENNQDKMNNVVALEDTQKMSGTSPIGGLEITSEGATIGEGGTMQVDENGIVQKDNTNLPAGTPKEEIINDDAETATDYGIPVIDIGAANSGTIKNEDIKF